MIKNLLAVLFGFFVAFVLAEVYLRIWPTEFTDYGDRVQHQFKPDVGRIMVPNQRNATNVRSCFKNKLIRSNSLGFRDDDWAIEKTGPRIAILGDSQMQALQIPDGEFLADLLEKRFNGAAEVLNFGIGGNATVQEWLLFDKYVKNYKPDIVLLFFTVNDVLGNSCSLNKDKVHRQKWGCARMDSGEVILEKPAYNQDYSPPPKGAKSFIKKHCKTCMTLRRLMLYRRRVRKPGGGVTVYWQVYMPPEDSAWTEAWELTRHFLVELDKDVTSSGAELVVFVNTEYMKVCDEWKKEAREYYPDIVIPSEFDLYRPVKRLREITAEHGIRMIDLEPYFLEYKMKHDLKAPYFYFRCDGHYSKLGHAVATDAVYDNLLGLMDRRGLRPITGESKTTIDQ